MAREVLSLNMDVTAASIDIEEMLTPRPHGSVIQIKSVEYDISTGSGGTVLPENMYIGLAPRSISTAITEVDHSTLINDMPEGTIFQTLIQESFSGNAKVEMVLGRRGVFLPKESLYAMDGEVFLGTNAASIGAGMPNVFALVEVEFEIVKLTNSIAVEIAEQGS